MKKFISTIFFIIAVPVLGFLLLQTLGDVIEQSTLSTRQKTSIKITVNTGKILGREKNLRFDGWGSGGIDKLRMMGISLTSTDGPLNIEQARELVVYCTETFLREINKNKKIRPYLCRYPFTSENVKIKISCHDKENRLVHPPFITYVCVLKGKVYYHIRNPYLKTVHEEPYEKALKIVNK